MGTRWHFSSPGPGPFCYEGDIRLADQIYDYFYDNQTNRYLNSYGGRVEVCYDGEYRPICDVGWDSVDAEVACRNFGYGTPSYCEFLLATPNTVCIQSCIGAGALSMLVCSYSPQMQRQ